MADSLQLLALPLLLFAVVVRRAERRIISLLGAAGSHSPETASALPSMGPLGRWQLGRLAASGAVVAAGAEHYFFVPAGYAAFRRSRRKRALILFAVLAVVAIVVLVFLR